MNRVAPGKLVLSITILAALAASHAFALPVPASPDPRSTAYLGVHIDDLTPQLASALKVNESSGAVIADVDQDGPACKAGLQENDVVIGFDGSRISGSEQLGSLIRAMAPGKVITLTVLRSGLKKDVKVTLGEWPHAPNVMLHPTPFQASAPLLLPGPHGNPRITADIEMPSFIAATTHHGLQVEMLSPQLADYFGVPRGRGVLVRSVERGSPAEAAGLKAGDVIVRVNNEQVQDLADWRRGMHANATKISVGILRDKREQTLVIDLGAGGGGSSELVLPDFEKDMQALLAEEGKWEPEIAQLSDDDFPSVPNQKELRELGRQIEKSTKLSQKDMQKMSREIEKAAKPSEKDLQRMTREFQKSMPSDSDLQQMRQQVEDSMKSWTPQLQQEMEQVRKQMEQQKLDLQELYKHFGDQPQF